MTKRFIGLISAALLGAALTGITCAPATAGGWGHGGLGFGHYHHRHHRHSSFSLGLSFLVPLFAYPAERYYRPPPPRIVYVPRPPVCQRFHGNARVDATGGRFYGTACLMADGRWHIVH